MKRRRLRRYNEIDFQDRVPVGNGYFLDFKVGKKSTIVYLFYGYTYVRSADLADEFGIKLFLVEAVRTGIHKSKLAKSFKMSRQTIDNYFNIVEKYGVAGLLDQNRNKDKKILEQVDLKKEIPGNKNKALIADRKAKREEIEDCQIKANFSFEDDGEVPAIEEKDQLFAETHDWEKTRYAGIFVYLMMLISKWKWLHLIMGYSGKYYKIFMVFVLMVARNLGSIEQLKNVHSREAGIILGISKIPSLPYVWKWFYAVAKKRISGSLLADFFKYQIRIGIISMWSWFIDGHLLPYTGNKKVHHSYYTQRRIPYPGQTNLVSTDSSGKITHFEIQEGLGDLKGHILELGLELQSKFGESPIMIFDREGYGAKFFHDLVTNNCPFVCWEKHINKEELDQIEETKFTIEFDFNEKKYQIFEGEKEFIFVDTNGETNTFTLRKIYIWNRKSNKRVCGLAWTGTQVVSSQDCARLILNRWGASENTFKHLGNRHPLHYRPGFKVTESENQEIANPDLKAKEKEISLMKKKLDRVNSKLAKCKPQFNRDGTPRLNSKYEKLNTERESLEEKLKICQSEKKTMPERIDLSTLEDYESFKKIDCEGKNLFDFVTASIWNARKKMVEFLTPYFRENEIVDLFYAITNLHGKIKCTDSYVKVKLEPLQQTKRLEAQKQLCRILTNKCPQLQNGKSLVIEVDEKMI